MQQVKLHRKAIAVLRDERIDAARVRFELMKLVGRQRSESAIRGGANLQHALRAVMLDELRAENFGQALPPHDGAERPSARAGPARSHTLREQHVVQ